MSKIYIFSGLGVDKRVFQKIDFSNFNIQFVDWIPPLKNESLENYAKRISNVITEPYPILVGLSFGGMVAIEIAKHLKVQKIILIASAKTKFEIPLVYRIIGKLKLNKFFPHSLLKKPFFITNWIFGIETNEERQLLKNILDDTDSSFLKWAINEIINWNNDIIPSKTFHIHGTNDRILPIKNINCDIKIINGGHFMTVNKAKEITEILNLALNRES